MTKVDPPSPHPPPQKVDRLPLQTESDKIPAHFDHFLELNNTSTGQIWRPYMHFPGSCGHLKNFFFSTFLYILQFSNGNNSLNKQDRNIVSNSKILSYLDSGSRKNMFFKFWVESLK